MRPWFDIGQKLTFKNKVKSLFTTEGTEKSVFVVYVLVVFVGWALLTVAAGQLAVVCRAMPDLRVAKFLQKNILVFLCALCGESLLKFFKVS